MGVGKATDGGFARIGLGFRDQRRWHGSSGDKFDQIHAEVNCPRCSRIMGVLFSTRPLSIAAGLTGVYQALNMCPNCRTAFYFRPTKLAPLQGSFVEIGRVNALKKNRIHYSGPLLPSGRDIEEMLKEHEKQSNMLSAKLVLTRPRPNQENEW
ncbi:hypothetical protein Acr_21g0001490 [Actinidia rufa]|uniref:Uncharacterized protein n=1 Tax=Actinidia rufa TaxID=165716 RepID=A0A7J0GFG1_9ERIC|nr:hypothetical protein Acr_21g0001490 [Actinidia rufa]